VTLNPTLAWFLSYAQFVEVAAVKEKKTAVNAMVAIKICFFIIVLFLKIVL
jgi:hypothetical protein